MTINTANYIVGSNEPLNHARILYAPLAGTVSGGGTNPSYAANDYTSQRWQLNPGSNAWTLQTAADATIDCVFIAAHNLSGKTVTISTAATAGGSHTRRTLFVPSDNSTIAAFFNTDALLRDLNTLRGTASTINTTWDDGVLRDATLFVGNTDAASHRLESGFQFTPVIGQRYKYSVDAKPQGYNYLAIINDGTNAWGAGNFTLIGNGTVAQRSAGATGTNPVFSITHLGNSVYRCTIEFTWTATAVNEVWLAPAPTSSFLISAEAHDGVSGVAFSRQQITIGASNADTIREVRVTVNEGSDIAVGIIRAGVALQMPIPIYGGHKPLNLNRVTEAQQQFSETGQWLGRIIKRQAVTSSYEWEYLSASWYDTYFDPFAQTLPLNPFCIAGNPSKITSDVGFVWTDRDPEPVQMGIQTYRSVSISVTGYY